MAEHVLEKMIIELGNRLETKIDDLAILVKGQFDRVDERFEQIDGRLDKMDQRFDRIENVSIGNHERRIDNLEDRVRVIENKGKRRKISR